jgi:hypothetical protein
MVGLRYNVGRFPSAQTVRKGPTGPVRLLLGGEAHRPRFLALKDCAETN